LPFIIYRFKLYASDVDEDDIDDFEEEDELQDLFVRILEDIQLNLP
jgi:hypothetical protein